MTSPRHVALSALFDSAQHLEEALARLELRGIPRDLIEVVVTPEAAKRFFPGKVHKVGSETQRYAGYGALWGLLAGSLISLASVFVFGFTRSTGLAIAQLLGPNVGTLLGAAIGALIGALVRKAPQPLYQRAVGRPEILLIVRDRPPDEVGPLSELLVAVGGREVAHA